MLGHGRFLAQAANKYGGGPQAAQFYGDREGPKRASYGRTAALPKSS
jgi:hypothetical protein